MKKYLSIRAVAPLFFTLVVISLPVIVLGAQNSNTVGPSASIENPLKVGNFCQLIKIVLQAILVIGVPIAVVFLVIVGFKFIIARGNPAELDKAKADFLHTVIGIAIFIGAWAIAKLIAATLAALGASDVNQCV